MRRVSIPLLLLALTAPALHAQNACVPGSATAVLDANNVRARLYNNGGLFWKGAGNVYNVPKAEPGKPFTPNALFTANLWVGGRVGGQVRQAAASYSNWEYYPGPLDAQGRLPADCTPYNRIASITQADVDTFRQGFIPVAVRTWPAAWGAPVVDGDGVAGNYNVAGGDRPEMLGTQMHWWVMNTMGPHLRTGSAPFPLEVQVTAFAAASPFPSLNDATFYRYRFVWRGTTPLTDFYAGFWTDMDLGNPSDDLVGADSARAMVYAYNADDQDEGSDGYGARPPAVGVLLMPGLQGAPDPPVATARLAFKSGARGDPHANTEGYYNLLRGLFSNGDPTYGCGDSFSAAYASCGTTRYTFTGSPELGTGWTMRTPLPLTTPFVPSDHRMMISAGPFTLAPEEVRDVVFAVAWARGSDHLNAIARLRTAADQLREVWRTNAMAQRFPEPQAPPAPGIPYSVSSIAPNPARTTARLRLGMPDQDRVRVTVFDALGRLVQRPHDGPLGPGTPEVPLDVSGLPTGVYRVRVQYGLIDVMRALVVVR